MPMPRLAGGGAGKVIDLLRGDNSASGRQAQEPLLLGGRPEAEAWGRPLTVNLDRPDDDLSPLATLTGRWVLWACVALVVIGVVGLAATTCG
jgi:hypothetical protein